MSVVLIVWLTIASVFFGIPGIYYLLMKSQSARPWKLAVGESYCPTVAILVPVHNEEKLIRLKLENLKQIRYPIEKVSIIVVNDASSDNTLAEVSQFISDYEYLKIRIFNNQEHIGKAAGLNKALEILDADVVVISDADCFWPSDILSKALPYLSDPAVGAVTAREYILNPSSSWVTLGEQFYDSTVQTIRVGESKMHSTIVFQGGFAAFKRDSIRKFDSAADDSGTALDVVQSNRRSLLVSEIGFFTTFPTIWRNKIGVKIRRASQLQHLWAKCMNLMLHRNLVLPKRIAVPEIFIHIFNPILFVLLSIFSVLVVIQTPLLLMVFATVLFPVLIYSKTRLVVAEMLQSNLVLLIALSSFIGGNSFKFWKSVREAQILVTRDLLIEKNLL